jgi:hypothetical protein
MKIERILTGLTVVNLVLLAFLLVRTQRAEAQGGPTVLRGSALEIVDDQGRIRASIQVQPEDRAHPMPDGSPRPETVMLRLIDPRGRPSVKLGGSEAGAGLGLVGVSDTTYVVLKAEGAEVSLKLVDKDGQQLVKP